MAWQECSDFALCVNSHLIIPLFIFRDQKGGLVSIGMIKVPLNSFIKCHIFCCLSGTAMVYILYLHVHWLE